MKSIKSTVLCLLLVALLIGPAAASDPASAQGTDPTFPATAEPEPEDPRQPEYIFSVAWSPDGSRIAVGMGPEICNQGNNDYSVRIVDATTGEIITRLADSRWSYCPTGALDWSPDGDYLIGTQLGSVAIVWDVNTGETLAVHGAPTPAGFINNLWSPSGDVIASTANVSPLVQIWNPFTGEVPIEFDAGSPVALAWRSDGNQLAASGDPITIWDAVSGELVSTLTPAAGLWVYWSPDDSMIASFSRERIYLWDASDGNLLVTLEGHTANLRQLAWSPDSRRLASAGLDGTVRVWNTVTGEHLAVFTSSGRVRSVDWSPDGTQLVYGGISSEEQDAELQIVVAPALPAADATVEARP